MRPNARPGRGRRIVLGGGFGGMFLGLPGALLGSYAGNELGLGLYDAFGSRMEDPSIPRRDGRVR